MVKTILKKTYNAVPFKKEIFSLIKTVWTPPETLYQHLHFKGTFTAKLPDGKTFKLFANHSQFENELFWSGIEQCWEQTSIPIWIKLCQDAEVVFDIGAQSGIFSMITKAESPNCEIHTFEPTDYFYKELTRHRDINNFDINCHQIALSNKEGINYIENVWQDNKNVQSTTMDAFIEANNIKKIDLVKIDVDHHEVEVAEGFQKYFKEFQPTVLVEVLRDETAQGIEKYWKTQELGYLVFSIHEKNGTIRQLPDMSKRGDNMNFLLCKPEVADKIGIPYKR